MQEVARQTQVAIIYLPNNVQITSQFHYYYMRMNVTNNAIPCIHVKCKIPWKRSNIKEFNSSYQKIPKNANQIAQWLFPQKTHNNDK